MIISFYDKNFKGLQNNAALVVDSSSFSLVRRAVDCDDLRCRCEAFTENIQLLDEEGNSYNRVQFSGKTLHEGQYIIINSASHKIYFFDGAVLSDYSAETDPQFDTFLFAKSGLSKLSINIDNANSGSLTGSWRQYSL